MATDPKTKPVRWEFDLYEKDFVARGHPLPVPATGIFDETLHCALINVQWLPHIIGALQILVEGDSWSGGDDELFRAQQEIMKLISSLSNPCSDGGGGGTVLISEFRTIALSALCDQNQWKYTVEPDTAWRNLGTPVCDGTDGEDGEPALPGEDGADGREIEIQTVSTGEGCFQIQWRYQGETEWLNSGDEICCACEETVPINPVEPGEEEFAGTACSVAINLTYKLRSLWNEAYSDTNGNIAGMIDGVTIPITGIALFLGSPVGAGAAVLLLDLLKRITLAVSGGVENSFDDPAEERFRCYLDCILEANNSLDITSDVISEWEASIRADPLMPEVNRDFVADLLADTPLDVWQWLAYASPEVNPAACDCVCDDDRLISWVVASSNAPEGFTTEIMIKLTSPDALPADVTVNIIATNGTASSADYTLLTASVIIPAGSVNGDTIPVSVAIATADGADNGETFTLTIESVDGPAVIDTDHDDHVVTITDEASCYEWDFTTSDGGWARWDVSGIFGSQLIGEWTEGIGWEDTYNSARGIRGIGIQKTFDDIDVLRVEIDYAATLGGDTDPGGSPIPIRVRGFYTSTSVRWSGQESSFPSGTVTFTYEPVDPTESVMKLELLSSVSTSNSSFPTDHGGSATIVAVRVYTNNPFAGDVFTGGHVC